MLRLQSERDAVRASHRNTGILICHRHSFMKRTDVFSSAVIRASFNCPRCRSSNTYSRDNARLFLKRRKMEDNADPIPTGTLHYCRDCKMAWTLHNSTAHKSSEDDDLYQGAATEICANCDRKMTVNGDASFMCSKMCGRSFHVECVSDPMHHSLVCKICSQDSLDTNPTEEMPLADTKEDLEEVLRWVTDPDADHSFPFASEGDWPPSCNERVATAGYEAPEIVPEDEEFSSKVDSEPEIISKRQSSHSPELIAPGELLRSIRLVWQRLMKDDASSDQRKSSFLDSVSEANLALDGGRFLDCLLRKVLSMRKVSSTTNASKMGRGTWRHVMFAAQSLGVDHSVIEGACSRLEVLYGSQAFSYEAISSDIAVEFVSANVPRLNARTTAALLRLKSSDVRSWEVPRVLQLLQELNLDALIESFDQNAIDGNTFLDLTYEDLKDDLELRDDHVIDIVLEVIANISENDPSAS